MKKQIRSVRKKVKPHAGRPRRDREEVLKDGYRISAYEGKKAKVKLPPALKINVEREPWMTDGDFEYLKVKYFYENYLKHPDGKPFILMDWEEEIISALMGTLNEDGKRRYRKAYISLPRKNGKSSLMAGLLLYFLTVVSEKHRFMQIYSAAGSSEQAGIVFRCASEMVKQNSQLSKIVRVIEFTKRMRNLRTDSTYFVLSRESGTAHGINAAMCVFDETFNQKDSFLWDAIERSMGTQPEPLLVSISTSGTNRESLCRRLYDYGKKVTSGEVSDPTFYCRIYEADDSDDWEDEEVWHKANPALRSGFRFIDEMRSSFNRAREIPSEENQFRNQYLNMWTAASVRWVTSSVWEGCGAPFSIAELEGRECWVGLDLGASRDITAAVFLFPPVNDDDIWRLVCFFWIPSENIEDRGRRDGAPYSSWVKAGFIMTTPGNVVDYAGIRSTLNEFAGKFKILGVGIDPWNSAQIAPALVEDGFEVVDIRQGYQSLSAPMKEFERLLLSKKISHNGNPVLRWMAESTVTIVDPAGNVKPDKSQRNRRIDGIVASIIAISISMKAPKQSGSVYDHRGLLFLGDPLVEPTRRSSHQEWNGLGIPPIRYVEDEPHEPQGDHPYCLRCIKQESGKKIFLIKKNNDLWDCPECGLHHTRDDLKINP
jgi:phage terminase large subunit-like protein